MSVLSCNDPLFLSAFCTSPDCVLGHSPVWLQTAAHADFCRTVRNHVFSVCCVEGTSYAEMTFALPNLVNPLTEPSLVFYTEQHSGFFSYNSYIQVIHIFLILMYKQVKVKMKLLLFKQFIANVSYRKRVPMWHRTINTLCHTIKLYRCLKGFCINPRKLK